MTMRVTLRSARLAAAIAIAVGSAETTNADVITVTTGGDAGTASTCTLRQAIQSANNDTGAGTGCADGTGTDTITFASILSGATITLTQGQLSIYTSLAIEGSGQTIDAAGPSRVLFISGSGTSLDASGLTVTGGAPGDTYSGGGIYGGDAENLHLDNCHIVGNSAQYGAAVAVEAGSTVTISNSVISGNTGISSAPSLSYGGGLLAYGSTVTFVRSTVSGNTATRAAGVWGRNSTFVFVDSTVSGNTATDAGGIYVFNSSTLTLTNSTVYNNTATNATGGVYVGNSAATLVNATVAGNHASKASGVAGRGTSITPSSITLYNSIVANNTSDDCYNDAFTSITAAYALIGNSGSACGITNGTNGNITGEDPQLGALSDNGGVTKTMALGPSSPALGAGNVALAVFNTAPLEYDQRGPGFPRTLPNGTIDIGAYQHQGSERIFANGFEPVP